MAATEGDIIMGMRARESHERGGASASMRRRRKPKNIALAKQLLDNYFSEPTEPTKTLVAQAVDTVLQNQ